MAKTAEEIAEDIFGKYDWEYSLSDQTEKQSDIDQLNARVAQILLDWEESIVYEADPANGVAMEEATG